MKLLIYTGKGGVGKTTCAAATALQLARQGIVTLVVSTDPAHSLGDCLQVPLDKEPSLVTPGLWGMEVDAREEMLTRFQRIRDVLVAQMKKRGINEMVAEEMVMFPGAEELFSLLKIVELKRTKKFEVIILDTAPTGNTMRFLNFPEFLSPVQRALRVDRTYSSIIRPFASFLGHKVPEDTFYTSAFALFDEIERARRKILGGETYFRFVLNPEKLAVLETQRAVSFLNVSGYTVDALLVNKILPDSLTDSFFETWKLTQRHHLNTVKECFYPLRIFEMPLYDREILGLEMLDAFGQELYNDVRPDHKLTDEPLFEVTSQGEEVHLNIQIPYGNRKDLKLLKNQHELKVHVGPYEQSLQLPAILQGLDIKRASYEGNRLSITFS